MFGSLYFVLVTATIGQTMTGKQDYTVNTFDYNSSGGIMVVDSVYSTKDTRGKIKLPVSYGGGFMYEKVLADASGVYPLWSVGAEYSTTLWSNYRFYEQPDAVVNSWQVKLGGQWIPDPKSINSYLSRVTYRAGFNYGKDYINADGNELKSYGITFGFGIPIRPARFTYQFTTLHTAFEFGKRGSNVNNITESYFRFSLGLSLSDIWFIKRKYD